MARYDIGTDDRKQLDAAVRRLVRDAGGVEMAGETVALSKSQVARWYDPNDNNSIPLYAAAALQLESGCVDVPKALARMMGCALVRLPQGCTDPKIARALGATCKEHGEAIEKIGAALSNDGKVDAGEIERLGILAEVREAQEALAQLEATLVSIAERGGGRQAAE